MRNVNRIFPLMGNLAGMWATKCPDWRFGQLIENFRRWHGGKYGNSDIFYLKDDIFESRFVEYMKTL